MPTTNTNHLANETSPYLLQHAHNPVDWHAWNERALTLARQLDKPILLSIGYSACHWCHVMEHESFEDEDTAQYMNEHFVCIKVDREERPDLDKVYQTAHQMLTQRAGGWPLNVILTPDTHAPFFAGTYFPKIPRYGMPSFVHVLGRVTEYYRDRKQELVEHNTAIRSAFRDMDAGDAPDITSSAMDAAVQELAGSYDREHGGFGKAPKFPHPTNIELCMRHGFSARDEGNLDTHSLDIAVHTLTAMAQGGLFDHLGGGFCRYSVDDQWAIPHFEKMLYDNAQLLPLYADGWLCRKDQFLREIALSTAQWVMEEMQSPAGGYYSSLDADSEGEEGKYYVWTEGEIREVLTNEEFDIAVACFGLDDTPNFEGKWHLNVAASGRDPTARGRLDGDRLDTVRRKLLDRRQTRVRPGRDEKILTSWNALMIKGMSHAGRILQQERLISSATKSLQYIRRSLWRNNRLLATAKDDRAHLNAYLDDYVFLIDAVLGLNRVRWNNDEIEFARQLADVVLERFEDQDRGGFFFTSDDHEELLHRPKPAADDAIPSGNGIAVRALIELGHLLGETRYLEAAERALRALSGSIARYPAAHATLVMATEAFLFAEDLVIIRGEKKAAKPWLDVQSGEYVPRTTTYFIPADAGSLPGVLENYKCGNDVTAYICRATSCSPPIRDIEEFINSLRGEKRKCVERSLH